LKVVLVVVRVELGERREREGMKGGLLRFFLGSDIEGCFL
jgi:hypothetical protein